MRRAPSHEAPLDTQALLGERVTVYETTEEGWAWGQSGRRLCRLAVGQCARRAGPAPTHKVTALRTLVFPAPVIKTAAAVRPAARRAASR